MKTRRTIVGLVILFGILGVLVSGASAASNWYLCSVDNVGSGYNGAFFVQLTGTCPSNPSAPPVAGQWYIFNPNTKNALLAVSLTALSSNQQVLVLVDPALAYSVLECMYLSK